MKIPRKYYPLACICCFILVVFFSAVHAYKPKEGFTSIDEVKDYFNEKKHRLERKLRQGKLAGIKIKDEGFRSLKKIFRS